MPVSRRLMGIAVKGMAWLLSRSGVPTIAGLGIKLTAGILLYLLLARLFRLNELSFIRTLYYKVQKKIHAMHWKQDLYKAAGLAIRRSRLHRLFSLREDGRPAFPHKLVYGCAEEKAKRYLNASLTSVYLFWDSLPEVIVISDGTPLRNIVQWPRKLEVISWKEAYRHFTDEGNHDICRYADRLVYGKKFASLIYLAQQTPLLYSDTDVLWYSTPDISSISPGIPPMSKWAAM